MESVDGGGVSKASLQFEESVKGFKEKVGDMGGTKVSSGRKPPGKKEFLNGLKSLFKEFEELDSEEKEDQFEALKGAVRALKECSSIKLGVVDKTKMAFKLFKAASFKELAFDASLKTGWAEGEAKAKAEFEPKGWKIKVRTGPVARSMAKMCAKYLMKTSSDKEEKIEDFELLKETVKELKESGLKGKKMGVVKKAADAFVSVIGKVKGYTSKEINQNSLRKYGEARKGAKLEKQGDLSVLVFNKGLSAQLSIRGLRRDVHTVTIEVTDEGFKVPEGITSGDNPKFLRKETFDSMDELEEAMKKAFLPNFERPLPPTPSKSLQAGDIPDVLEGYKSPGEEL